MTGYLLTEASTAKAVPGTKGIWRAKLIAADVQGSTGFYPAAVLERDGGSAFQAGTHIYFDHPTDEESWQRPERSVRDLVGALIEDATYVANDPEGPGLYARVQFFPNFREEIEGRAGILPVEMSIRAAGTLEETDTGTVVTSIVQGVSVDIVTHAGAGGRLVEMTENARQQTPTNVPAITVGGSFTEADRQNINNLASSVTTLSESFGNFLKSLEESRKAKEQAAKDAATLTPGQITSKLIASGLPAASQARLAESYVSGQDFDAAITTEKTYVQSITEAAKGGKAVITGQQAGSVETDNSAVDVKEAESNADLFDSLFG